MIFDCLHVLSKNWNWKFKKKSVYIESIITLSRYSVRLQEAKSDRNIAQTHVSQGKFYNYKKTLE